MSDRKKKSAFSLVLGVVMLLSGIFIAALCFPPLCDQELLKPLGLLLTSSLALTGGKYANLAPGILLSLCGILLLLFRRRKRASMILIPYLIIVYYTLLVIFHYRLGITTPAILMRNIQDRTRFITVCVAFALEIVLFMLLIVITSAIDKKMAVGRKSKEESANGGDEEAQVPEKGEQKQLEKEKKLALKEARKREKQQKKRDKVESDGNAEEEEVVKVEATPAKPSGETDPEKPIVFPDISLRLPSSSSFDSIPDPEEVPPSPPQAEEERVESAAVREEPPHTTQVVTSPSVFNSVKAEQEKREKIDINRPHTFKKGGIIESTIEALSKEQQQNKRGSDSSKPGPARKGGLLESSIEAVKKEQHNQSQQAQEQPKAQEQPQSVNRSPIIGYDGHRGSEKKEVKKGGSFAPSNLSPDHPRYKLFESLQRRPSHSQSDSVTHFPSRPFTPEEEKKSPGNGGVPETLGEAIERNDSAPVIEVKKPSSEQEHYRTLLEEKEAEIRALEEKQRALEAKTHQLEEMVQQSKRTVTPEPEVRRKVVDVEVRSEDHELSRSSSYYQEESTAKAVNGAIIEDAKAVEVEPSGSDLIEFRAGVGGLASNNAGEAAIIDRARRGYTPPSEEFLRIYPATSYEVDASTRATGESIVSLLEEFRIEVTLKDIVKGPTITLFEFDLAPGIMINKVLSLRDNIAMRLGGKTIRLLAPVPGRGSIGVEVPNPVRVTVGFRELIKPLRESNLKVPMILGRDITGNPQMLDVAKTPHLLIAGTTGSGKSVCINGLIASIIYTKSPKEVRLLMIDPKIVELQVYNGIPHLLTPVITDFKRVLKILDWLVEEMERRYRMFAQIGARNIEGFNARTPELGYATEKMPYIVLIMDEFADLMQVIGKDIESYVSRLMAKSRAAGIHVVMATQRPSSEVVTGTIKSNIPSRISFAVSSGMNSRIILDQTGAEDLLGKGDMLYLNPAASEPARIQGAFLSDDEVEEIANAVKKQGEPDYLDESIFEDEVEPEESYDSESLGSSESDLYEQAKQIVFERKGASASYLQRRLSIGYNKAAKLVEQMEDEGIVGPANGSKPREILKYE